MQGCENNFRAVCQGVKKRDLKKCALFVFVFCWKKKKEKNMKQIEKENSHRLPEKLCFWVVVKNSFFAKLSFLKNGQTLICVRKVKKRRAFSLQLSVFGKWHFLYLSQITKHYKKGFSRHRGKPKMALFVSKVSFWVFPSKAGFTICDTQKLCSAENIVLWCFQRNTALQK